jgi:hypothetical protein
MEDFQMGEMALGKAEGVVEHDLPFAVAAQGHQDRTQGHAGLLLQGAPAAFASAVGPNKEI